ncbi:hypothetical protein B0H11DRAFT_602264 [Mycena galericulata]|nr:hypothetical protein B0H11DRAFT_602264 [Mycena galericulata]
MSKDVKPLALSATLRDLALLRASGLDISSLLPPPATKATLTPGTADATVERSYEFARQAQAAIKIYNGDVDLENVGALTEGLHAQIQELSKGLQDTGRS